ncbi:MAG: DUF1722 domain-containing protein [Gammaproteobacteria bacterium]|nr:DUF1722 domain-containing protein [Gammaproteobacteria bacterium]NIR85287.1 DUF1722 domain-containing protein [Gammaproteobacteria bacterium]NIR88403.1 DUF1722 domain-containing protein [Gammaproteobacteria bacterium]NIU06353.1 DUF1722 domain-containing protein [Gammaproteobacteria bacterium]NIV53252.1 DUF1722 domain-containing protein [Gammaproteobacteria bacterium]
MSDSSEPSQKVQIGISSCLLGEAVRFDKGHKRDGFITGTLSQYFDFVPLCPEVAIGMGVPREPIRLIGDAEGPRAVGVRTESLDVTGALVDYGRRMANELNDISGYIFKSKSPSCGMERVKLYSSRGPASKNGVGLYAREIMRGRPLLPVEEEGRLNDPVLRENFIERVFAYRRWQDVVASHLTPAKVVAFHTAHKLSLMAHGPEQFRHLGRLVADAGKRPLGELAEEYVSGFMDAMKRRATRKRHANVLMHLMGYLKRKLDPDDKAELREIIDAYRLGYVPLVVPITLLNHHFRRHPDPYVAQQVYLNPHPKELMLRNHV